MGFIISFFLGIKGFELVIVFFVFLLGVVRIFRDLKKVNGLNNRLVVVRLNYSFVCFFGFVSVNLFGIPIILNFIC